MGANIKIENIKSSFCEKTCSITASYSHDLKGIRINKENLIPMIDEIPILSIVASIAKGKTIIQDAEELRLKESDRLTAIYSNLSAMGGEVTLNNDGIIINGGKRLYNATISSFNDHRISMSFEILHLYLNNKLLREDNNLFKISFPDFYSSLKVLLNG